MESYLRIAYRDGTTKKVPFSRLVKLLGAKPDVLRIELCQDIPAGELAAVITGPAYEDRYPGIDLEVRLPKEASSSPALLARCEQPLGDGLKTYLYGRNDQYIAYSEADVRSDAIVDDAPVDSVLVISGDPDNNIQVYRENNYVHFCGQLRDDDLFTTPAGKVSIVSYNADNILITHEFETINEALERFKSNDRFMGGNQVMVASIGGTRVFDAEGDRDKAICTHDLMQLLCQQMAAS